MTPAIERWGIKAMPGDLHWWKCQQFWLEHTHIPLDRKRAATFISSLKTGRALRRRSLPSRTVERRSSTKASICAGSDESLI